MIYGTKQKTYNMKKITLVLMFALTSSIVINAQIKARGFDTADVPELRKMARKGMFVNHDPMRIGTRENAELTCMGSPKVPVVLVNFIDKDFTTTGEKSPNQFYDLHMNGTGDGNRYTGSGSFGSVRDYFSDMSYGQFTPEFVIIGPVTLSKSYKYYGENSGSSLDIHINDFYKEALDSAMLKTDWSQFDNNDDGSVDMVFFVYAGRGENDKSDRDTYTIWPKENGRGGTIGDVKFGCYVCCNEEYRSKVDGIGTMCHELSHALGLPDLYDTNYRAFGMDYWDLMDSGNYCQNGCTPCGYSAYERDFMGWRSLITLEADQGKTITLKPMTQDGYGYKIVNKENPNEYYILENRQSEDWDKYIGYGNSTYGFHPGLLVTHVDYVQSRWTNNNVNTDLNHQYLTIIPADSTLDSFMFVATTEELLYYLESAAGDPYPGKTDKTDLQGKKAFVYTTSGEMNQPITGITQNTDGSITLQFCGGDTDEIETVCPTLQGKKDYVYDLQGRLLMTDDVESLPTGIYIINGKTRLINKK